MTAASSPTRWPPQSGSSPRSSSRAERSANRMLLDGPSDWLRAARGVFGPRRRRWATGGPRLHVEVRIEQPEDAAALASRLGDLAQGEPGIAWVDVIFVLRRAVLAFDPVAIDPERLVALGAGGEAEGGFGGRPFPLAVPGPPAHP